MNKLSMVRGDSATVTVDITDEDGYPLDLDSVASVRFTARRAYDDGSAVIAKDQDDGVTWDDPSAGVITVALLPEDTSDLARTERLLWDVQVVGAEDDTRTVARGYLWVHRDATT